MIFISLCKSPTEVDYCDSGRLVVFPTFPVSAPRSLLEACFRSYFRSPVDLKTFPLLWFIRPSRSLLFVTRGLKLQWTGMATEDKGSPACTGNPQMTNGVIPFKASKLGKPMLPNRPIGSQPGELHVNMRISLRSSATTHPIVSSHGM